MSVRLVGCVWKQRDIHISSCRIENGDANQIVIQVGFVTAFWW